MCVDIYVFLINKVIGAICFSSDTDAENSLLVLTPNLSSVSFLLWNRNALNLYWAFFTGAGQRWCWELKNFVDLKGSNTQLLF